MPRKPDVRITEAKELYKQGVKLVEIASQLNLPEGTVRRWKSTHNWDSERSDKNSERSDRKHGGQPGNKNATGHGAPKKNSNAEKYGLFRKYLPEETFSIIQEMPTNPLDILWDQIQIAYAAIIRAQQIMYVKDKNDSTTTKIGESFGDTSSSTKWEVQQAWDKHGSFMQAQARAQKTLESMLKQYEEQLHKNWELATEEQRVRIDVMRVKAQLNESTEIADDGFLEALSGTAVEDWANEED